LVLALLYFLCFGSANFGLNPMWHEPACIVLNKEAALAAQYHDAVA
jgi:hypothetical protein